MVGSFSTLQEFLKHWSTMPEALHADATQKLEEASTEVRALYPDTDQRLAAGTLALKTVQLVVNRMVKRALDTAAEELAGVTSATAQAGPFSQTLAFANPDATMYMSKADHRLMKAGRNSAQAWTIYPGS